MHQLLLVIEFGGLFLIGIVVGSFLNVCIARLPLEKSLLWPGSRCGSCYRPIRWYDNLPLLSYVILRGRCRWCGATFSMRYFWVELLTGLGFVGLFYLEMVLNIHQWPVPLGGAWAIRAGFFPWQWWLGYAFHCLLFCFLLVAALCDLQSMYIPIRVTMTGTVVGLAGAVLMPWPWPYTPEEALAPIRAFEQRYHGKQEIPWWIIMDPKTTPEQGVYPWPVWGPLPEFLKPGGNWQTGLATGVAGILVGTFMMRAMAFVFSRGLGREALGMGDADLMMMAGAFLGWQPVVVAFFVSVFPALLFGIYRLVARRDNTLPFGPSLAIGTMLTMLCWRGIGPMVQWLFFWDVVLIILAVLAAGFMFVASYMIRVARPTPKP